MNEERKTDRLDKIKEIAQRWLETKGHNAQMWDITATMYLYADDCIVNVDYRYDSAMSWNPGNRQISNKEIRDRRQRIYNPFAKQDTVLTRR